MGKFPCDRVFVWCGLTLWSNYLLKPQNTFTPRNHHAFLLAPSRSCVHPQNSLFSIAMVKLIFDVCFLANLVIETLNFPSAWAHSICLNLHKLFQFPRKKTNLAPNIQQWNGVGNTKTNCSVQTLAKTKI